MTDPESRKAADLLIDYAIRVARSIERDGDDSDISTTAIAITVGAVIGMCRDAANSTATLACVIAGLRDALSVMQSRREATRT